MIVFLHVPKTAGTSFQSILANNFALSHCHTNHISAHDHLSYAGRKPFTPDDLNFARKVFPRLKSIAGHNLADPMKLPVPDPFYMTFLRDPVSRVISQYQERTLNNRKRGRPVLSFEDALRVDPELKNLNVKLLAGEENLDKAKRFLERCAFVGLTEKFDLSLHVLGRLCPEKLDLRYQKRRVQKEDSLKKSIEADNRLIEMARDYNRMGIELYSFAVKEIFPKLCEKTGLNPDAPVASFGDNSRRLRPKLLVNRFYNKSIYRQLCKIRNRRLRRKSAGATAPAGNVSC
jgi:hypothetical protein